MLLHSQQSAFFGSVAAGFWRRGFNLNTSIARKETATETGLEWICRNALSFWAQVPGAAACSFLLLLSTWLAACHLFKMALRTVWVPGSWLVN